MIIPFNKPRGVSSFAALRQFKSQYKGQKVGHAGTLDPLAEGLLLVLVGREDTKKQAELMQLPKTYRFTVIFGLDSKTGDLEGPLKINSAPPTINAIKIKTVLRLLVGEIDLPLPVYSAIKINGRRAYRLARQGVELKMPLRAAKIYSLKLIKVYTQAPVAVKNWLPQAAQQLPAAEFEAKVGKGTYIRSLAQVIGQKLGTSATVARLIRTKIGDYRLADALSSQPD